MSGEARAAAPDGAGSHGGGDAAGTRGAHGAGGARAAATPRADGARDAHARSARDRFVVVPFTGDPAQRSVEYLGAGLPAIIAERLAIHPGLRFAGAPSLIERVRVDEAAERAKAAGVKWIVAGRFERRRDWRVEVTVSVFAATNPVTPAAEAKILGTKEEASRTGLRAALDAFAALGKTVSGAERASITAPFSRDPYAFVLYARGVGAYAGVAGGRGPAAERAQTAISRSLVIDPRVPETRRFLGMMHMAAGKPGHARAAWSYALDVRPDYLAVLSALAALDRAAGLPIARERYRRVLELDPDDLEARRAHGELLLDAGQLEEAQAELQKVVSASPGDLRARRALALVLASRRAGNELASELTEIVRLDPGDLDARFELGAAYASVGKLEQAIAAYDEILRRKPRHAAALKIIADLHRARGDMVKAATYYERLRKVAPDDPRAVFLLGAAYYESGRLDAAERAFSEGAHFPGMLGDAYSNLGAIAYRRGHMKEALYFLNRAAQRRPGKANVRYNYALALAAVERLEDAETELTAAVRADPKDAEIRFLSGVVALRMGRLADAEKHFQDAVRLSPHHEGAKHNLALLESLRATKRSETSVTIPR